MMAWALSKVLRACRPDLRQLTRDQMTAVLQDQLGFGSVQPLPSALNASKGPRLADKWNSFRGQALDANYLSELRRRQYTIQMQIDRQIKIFLQANKVGNK